MAIYFNVLWSFKHLFIKSALFLRDSDNTQNLIYTKNKGKRTGAPFAIEFEKKTIRVRQVWFDVNETKLLTDQWCMQIYLARGVWTCME